MLVPKVDAPPLPNTPNTTKFSTVVVEVKLVATVWFVTSELNVVLNTGKRPVVKVTGW